MSLFINSNIPSLTAQRHLAEINRQLGLTYRRLSSGLRINSAADDPAGLAMSERMRARTRMLQVERRALLDDVSRSEIAEASLNTVSGILIRLRELAVQANTGTASPRDVAAMDREFQGLLEEIDRISASTGFNGTALLEDIDTETLEIDDLSLSADDDAPKEAMEKLDGAIDTVSRTRAEFGAHLNALEHRSSFLDTMIENLVAAESRIRDTDYAVETARLARLQILQQAAIAVLSQANVQPRLALKLLG